MSNAASNRRLYVNHIASSVDEYTLVQLFTKYGKISDFNFLFHKTGPLKGKPKGYAFIEMATAKEALNAMSELDNKLVRGQRLSVSLSTSKGPEPNDGSRSTSGKRRPISEAAKPTTLSLMKTGRGNESTSSKIRALEAKLAKMKQDEQPAGAVDPRPSSSSSLHVPDSLPQKPKFEATETREM